MKPKERCKEGKKYVFIGKPSRFGAILLWADNIKDFRVCDLEDVSKGDALLMKSVDSNVVRIKCNGTKWYA